MFRFGVVFITIEISVYRGRATMRTGTGSGSVSLVVCFKSCGASASRVAAGTCSGRLIGNVGHCEGVSLQNAATRLWSKPDLGLFEEEEEIVHC